MINTFDHVLLGDLFKNFIHRFVECFPISDVRRLNSLLRIVRNFGLLCEPADFSTNVGVVRSSEVVWSKIFRRII